MPAILTTHIEVDEKSVAWIVGANTKVVEVVLDKLAYGWSPEEIHFQHPSLSLSQIHAALAYYYDHQAELDAEILRRQEDAETLATQVADSRLRQKLLDLKKQQ